MHQDDKGLLLIKIVQIILDKVVHVYLKKLLPSEIRNVLLKIKWASKICT